MSQFYISLAEQLINLECVLRQQRLWADEEPSSEALASQQPFCIDTLTFPEWLQFVFLPRMQILVETKAALPEKSDIAPMAEEYFKGLPLSGTEMVSILRKIDELLTRRRYMSS